MGLYCSRESLSFKKVQDRRCARRDTVVTKSIRCGHLDLGNCGANMGYTVINFEEKLASFSEHWSPKIVAQMNDTHFKLVKIQGDFVWHSHADTDEVFIVLGGEMTIDFRAGRVDLERGEMFVVPRGVEHKSIAKEECKILLVEPAGTINTGDAGGELTAQDEVWI